MLGTRLVTAIIFLISSVTSQTVSTGCVNDKEYVHLGTATRTHTEAKGDCVGRGEVLPVPKSVDEDEFVRNFAVSVVANRDFWIGFEAPPASDLNLPSSFGINEGEFGFNANDAPWVSGQPDGTGDRVKFDRGGGSQGWISVNDGASNVVVVCERACTQTGAPTTSPTGNPTTSPTQNPTKNPTTSPSKNPTTFPTDNPTKSPTFTQSPTDSPTIESSPAAAATPIGVIAAVSGVITIGALGGAFVLLRRRNRSSRISANNDHKPAKMGDIEAPKGFNSSGRMKPNAIQPQSKADQAQDLAKLDAMVSANMKKAEVAISSSKKVKAKAKPTQKKEAVDDDVATLDALVSANMKGSSSTKAVDEDVAMLDALVSANTKNPEDDVATLDAIVAANTAPPPVAADQARPESAYLKSAELRPEGRKSIFAPSEEYMKKAVASKKKKMKEKKAANAKEDDLDLSI